VHEVGICRSEQTRLTVRPGRQLGCLETKRERCEENGVGIVENGGGGAWDWLYSTKPWWSTVDERKRREGEEDSGEGRQKLCRRRQGRRETGAA
ncbi:hypothetical protein HAX54_030338, partial [Datura stramonium]|nr:hypothetical protein [Datura stramonium]